MLRAVIVVFVDDFLHGRPEDMGRAMRLTVRRAHRLIGAELQYVLLCLLGGMLLLLPGFLAFAALFAFPQAIMLEDSDVTTAMHRSSTLTQDRVLRTGGVLAMGMIIPFVLSLSVMAVTTFAAARMAWPPVVPRIGEVLATVAFSPFTSVFNTLLYFDLRVRKEGLDLERLVGTLADDTTTAEPGASPRAPAPAFVDSAS